MDVGVSQMKLGLTKTYGTGLYKSVLLNDDEKISIEYCETEDGIHKWILEFGSEKETHDTGVIKVIQGEYSEISKLVKKEIEHFDSHVTVT